MSLPKMTKEDLASRLDDPALTLIDLRVNYDSSPLKIRRAVRRDPAAVRSWASAYPKDALIVIYCSSPGEKDSRSAVEALTAEGFTNVHVLSGGWTVWQTAGLPTEKRIPDPLPKGVVPDAGKP